MLEIGILTLIFIFSILLFKKNFDIGIKVLLILSTFLHKEVFSIYRWDFLPVRFFMLGLFAYSLYEVFLRLRQGKIVDKISNFIRDPFVLLILLIWFIRAISMVFSKNIPASIMLLGFYTTVVVMSFMFYGRLLSHSDKLLKFIRFYIYVTFGLVLFGFFQLFLYLNYEIIIGALWNVPGHMPRIGSTFWDVNHFAALLAGLLPVLGVLILVDKPLKKKAAYALMFFTMTGMLFLTSSRTSWIIAAVSLLSFLTLLLVRKVGAKGILYIFVALVLISLPFLREYSIKSSPFRAYIKQNFHYRLDSFASHLMLIEGSYQIFEEYPILGGGYGSFFEHFRKTPVAATFFSRDPAALNTRVPAHTIWGEAMAETGVVGLSLLTLFLLTILSVLLYGAMKLKDKKEYLLTGAMFSTVLGLFTAGIFYSYNAEFFWILLIFYFTYGLSVLGGKDAYEKVFSRYVKSSKFLFFVILSISAVLIFSKLGSTHLIPWDEAIYSKIAKNIVIKGEYMNMYWHPDKIWYEKPPLFMWLVSFSMKLFGFGSFAARLPSALFGLGTVAVTFLLAKKLFGKIAAFVSSLALVTGIHFLYYSRAAMIDVTTTFFFCLGMYFYLKAKENKKTSFWFISGLALGLGMLTKGAVGLIPMAVIGLYELYLTFFHKEKIDSEKIKNALILFIAAMVVALPWHIIMYLRYGNFFLDNYLIYHVFERAKEGIEEKGQPFYWYFIVMKVSMRLWFIPLIPGIFFFLYKFLKKKKEYVFVLLWFVVVLGLFSVAKSKVVWYIMPVYPAASIVAGVFIQEAYKLIQKYVPYAKKIHVTFMFFFIMTVFSLTYLFYHKKMVYTSDLTGAQAELLKKKDEELGTKDMLWVDRVELPIVLYYTDGPFEIIDLEISKGRAPVMNYNERLIFMAKKGRFPKDPNFYPQEPNIIEERGDYILWYYKSGLEVEEERLEEEAKEK